MTPSTAMSRLSVPSLRLCRSRASSSTCNQSYRNPSSSSSNPSSPPHSSSSLIHRATTPTVFKRTESLVKNLERSLILHEPGRFLILQKPYGVSCLGFKQKGGGVFKNSVHNSIDREEEGDDEGLGSMESLTKSVTVADCIPQLSKIFREPHLGFCSGLKRYVSGPLILPCTKREYDLMVSSLRRGSGEKKDNESFYMHSALVIVIGKPESDEGNVKGYATFQPVGSHREYIFIEGRSNKRARTGKYAVDGEMEWRRLASGHGCSLLHIQFTKFARHLPRLLLSHLNTPILGDSLYSNRLFDVDGSAVRMEPAKAARNKGKRFVPRELLVKLERDSLEGLPLYAHVWQTVLPRYCGGASDVDLVASAPPPSHFTAMIDLLGFNKELKLFWNENIDPYGEEE